MMKHYKIKNYGNNLKNQYCFPIQSEDKSSQEDNEKFGQVT